MQLALELWFYKGTVNFIIELVREGLKNKKNKKYGIFHNREYHYTFFPDPKCRQMI